MPGVSPWRVAAVLAIPAATLAAQATPPQKADGVDPSRLSAYHQTFRVVQVASGAEKQVATVDDALIITQTEIIRRQSLGNERGEMVDSSVVDRATLKPRWHSSRSKQRTMTLEFTPGRVTGKYAEQSAPAHDINEKIGEGVYDASVLDVLIAALPLAEGYRGELRVFLLEAGGEISAVVAVTGSEIVGGQDTWGVDVTLKEKTAKYNVTKAKPHVVRIVSSPAPGMEIRFVQ